MAKACLSTSTSSTMSNNGCSALHCDSFFSLLYKYAFNCTTSCENFSAARRPQACQYWLCKCANCWYIVASVCKTIFCCSGMFTKPSWVRYLSSGLLLWWSMNGGWTAVVTTLLASIISFFFCVETLGTPVACKFSHAALTNTYLTGYFYRAVMMVRVL